MSRGRKAPAHIQELARLRMEHRHVVHAEYERAEHATHGVMLNALGKHNRIDPWHLFRKNSAFRDKYASEELRDHLARYPHITFEQFERQLQEVEPW